MHTKDQIVEMLATRDVAIGRALVALHKRQTDDEKLHQNTCKKNGRGFRPCDAFVGSSMAEFYQKNGYITSKQAAYWRKPMKNGQMKIAIYANQLLVVAGETK
jgi:hypothetical protein